MPAHKVVFGKNNESVFENYACNNKDYQTLLVICFGPDIIVYLKRLTDIFNH